MGKGLLRKLKEEQQPQHTEQYIDLGALEASGEMKESSGPELRVAEIPRSSKMAGRRSI